MPGVCRQCLDRLDELWQVGTGLPPVQHPRPERGRHPRGYQLHPAEKGYTGILACVHRTQEEMRRELYTVVDQGGTVVDVAVENSLYGEIRATLNLCNRYDVDNFIRQAADAPESLLSRMTGGVHLHTLRCPDKDTFARIRAALEQQGLLYRKE